MLIFFKENPSTVHKLHRQGPHCAELYPLCVCMHRQLPILKFYHGSAQLIRLQFSIAERFLMCATCTWAL